MQFKIFSIPYHGDYEKEEELNTFLSSKKIVSVNKEVIQLNNEAFWCFCIRWVAGNVNNNSRKVDYTKNLSKSEFDKYERLRSVRKEVANELGIPVYAVFNNKELSEICKLDEVDTNSLLKINGIGNGRLDKIGETFFKFLKKTSEKS